MQVVFYSRVSSEEQNQGDAVSIGQQLQDQQALAEKNGWTVLETFVDAENYRATQPPKKGMIVSPSGERCDRPGLLALLEIVKTGEVDAVLCWRDDRLTRHPRVGVALEDALDLGDAARPGKPKIQIYDASGAVIDRFVLSIKSSVWKQENVRRIERTRMGKKGTLQAGSWPGIYDRLGYTTTSEPGKRGRRIELVPEEAKIVQQVFDLYDSGASLSEVRRRLIASGAGQKGHPTRTHDWAETIILKLLTCDDFTGEATWRFADGTEYAITIPRIIEPEQWERVQGRIGRNKTLATRNAKAPYLLQGILTCGECNGGTSVNTRQFRSWRRADGTMQKRPLEMPDHTYKCTVAAKYREGTHPQPYHWHGADLDWAVWRTLVDKGISQPDLLKLQVLARQEELQRQGESLDSDIAHARRRLGEVDDERAFYQRAAAKGKITEPEFDARMEESEEAAKHWQAEIKRLTELRDDAERVEAGLSYIEALLGNLQARLPSIDQTPEELAKLPVDRQRAILEERRTVIRALCEKVIVWSSGRVKVVGAVDGSEARQFDLVSP